MFEKKRKPVQLHYHLGFCETHGLVVIQGTPPHLTALDISSCGCPISTIGKITSFEQVRELTKVGYKPEEQKIPFCDGAVIFE